MESGGTEAPKVLNELFEIVSYNGSAQDGEEGRYGVQNVLSTSRPVHCTAPGQNFDLVLKCKNEAGFTLSHFVVRGGSNCTAPLKDGLLWISDTEPAISEYASRYNDFTAEQFASLNRTDNPQEPILCFSTDPSTLEFQHEFPQWVTGNYVHLKWLTRHGDDSNVDIDHIGLIGFEGKDHQTRPIGPVPEELGITRPSPKACNPLIPEFVRLFKEKPSVVLFSDDESAIARLKQVAEQSEHRDSLCFFYSPRHPTNRFALQVADLAGVDVAKAEEDEGEERHPLASLLYIISLSSREKHRMNGDFTQPGAIETFIAQFKGGSLKPFLKSAKRPNGDSDPAHPGILVVVADSFEELVLDPNMDVLLDVYADWCGPCRRAGPMIAEVAKLLQDHPTIKVAKIDCDANDIDSEYLPETSIPNIKFFPRCQPGQKKTPIKYEGERTVSAFLRFIHDHSTDKFDIESMLMDVLKQEAIDRKKAELAKTLAQATDALAVINEGDSSKVPADVLEKIRNSVRALLDAINDEHATAESLEEALDKHRALEQDVALVLQAAAEVKEEKERAQLKKVRKMHDDAEFRRTMDEHKDTDTLVVIDFTAVWCMPCQMIAPVFADLSEEHTSVVFLKVDVDDLKETSEAAGVSAMPTFQFYKRGQKIDEVVGGNLNKITRLIDAHK